MLACEIGPATVYAGNILEVRMTIANPSISTLISSDPPPGYIYDEGEDFAAAGFAKIADTYRFGLDFKSNSGTTNPYRWGFGDPLAPGEEREVVGYVRMNRRRTTTWTASVVKEFVRYIVDHDFPQKIVVAEPPIGAQPASGDAGVRYFSETGHNVPGAFAGYWEANGGLPRFGYPLTEAFEEVSETDGGRYLTQYFERARFEYHPEYQGTKDEVLLGLLGVELTRGRHNDSGFRRVTAPPTTAGCSGSLIPATPWGAASAPFGNHTGVCRSLDTLSPRSLRSVPDRRRTARCPVLRAQPV